MKLENSRQIFGKNAQISNFMKIHPVGAELFYAQNERRDEIKSVFANFCERAYKVMSLCFVRTTASARYADRRERNATNLTVRFLLHPRSGVSGKNRIEEFPRWICDLTI